MDDQKISIGQSDEQILLCDISDEALEAAAETTADRGGYYTLLGCTGLSACPA